MYLLAMCLVTTCVLYVKADKEMSTLDIFCKQLTPSICPGHGDWASYCPTEFRQKRDRAGRKRVKYQLYKMLKTWDEALKVCQAKGGTLAMPKTKERQRGLKKTSRRSGFTFSNLRVWIGLKDVDGHNTYQWIDGKPLTYTYWSQGEPNSQDERCVTYIASYTFMDGWHDTDCEWKYGFMCQNQKP